MQGIPNSIVQLSQTIIFPLAFGDAILDGEIWTLN
jgi:hypothetical protein